MREQNGILSKVWIHVCLGMLKKGLQKDALLHFCKV
jgi:hypothetical protein